MAYLPTCVVASSRRLLWVNLDPARRCHISMHVRFAPKADKKQIVWVCPLSATTGQVGNFAASLCTKRRKPNGAPRKPRSVAPRLNNGKPPAGGSILPRASSTQELWGTLDLPELVVHAGAEDVVAQVADLGVRLKSTRAARPKGEACGNRFINPQPPRDLI